MPVGAAAGVGAVGSIYSGIQNSNNASKAMNMQQAALQQNLDLQRQFMAQQQATYGPLQKQLIQMATSDQPLDYGLNSGAIQTNADAAERNLAQQMAMRGLSGSGVQAAGATGLELGRANALSQAFQQGLVNRRNLGVNLLSQYNPAQGPMMVGNALSQQAGMFGNFAGMYNNAAQQSWGGLGQGLNAWAQNYQLQQAINKMNPTITDGTGQAGEDSMLYNGGAAPMAMNGNPYGMGSGVFGPWSLNPQSAQAPLSTGSSMNANSPYGAGSGVFGPWSLSGQTDLSNSNSSNTHSVQ